MSTPDTEDLARLVRPGTWPDLAAALRTWVSEQRWFQGKARTLAGVDVADAALMPAEPPVLLVLLEIAYAGGRSERYQVPLSAGGPHDVEVSVGGRTLHLRDALTDARASAALAAAALREQGIETAGGAGISGVPVVGANGPLEGAFRPVGVEQSNTSVVLGDRILKVFRRLEEGPNPDVELTRALTAAGFEHVPAQLGAVVLRAGASETTLAVLSTFAHGAEEGWALACRQADSVARGAPVDEFAASVGDLGQVVGSMHATLQAVLGEVPAEAGLPAAWSQAMRRQLDTVLEQALERAPAETAAVLDGREAITERLEAVARLEAPGPLIRTHGDLHLGQVLMHRDRWLVLDFEGEPARPLSERLLPQSPLRDVAGMLRSFDYAAAHASADVPPPLAAWRDRLRAAFLEGYLATARPAGVVADEPVAGVLLDAFELDKAVYELGYELANRPAWVAIPVGGILRVLEGR